MNCLLIRWSNANTVRNHCASSFAAGIAFYLYPDPQLLAHATATAVQLTWDNYIQQNSDSERPTVINVMNRLELARLFYPLAFAYLLHVRVFYPWLAPSVLQNLMHLTTNFK